MKILEVHDRFYVDVISCAAPRHPSLSEDKDSQGEQVEKYADAKDEEQMALKIKYIMRTAAKMGVTHLVLGALGCGAYRRTSRRNAEKSHTREETRQIARRRMERFRNRAYCFGNLGRHRQY